MAGMGFRLARSQGMEGSTGNLNEFPIATGYTTAIYRGDLVTLNAGNIEKSTGAAGAKVLGIFWGCKFTNANGDVEHAQMWTGAAGRSGITAQIAVMPAGATMLVKGADGATYTAADIGTRKIANVTGGGDARTGMSRAVLGPPGATVATAPLVVLGRVDFADGENWFEVSLAGDASVLSLGA